MLFDFDDTEGGGMSGMAVDMALADQLDSGLVLSSLFGSAVVPHLLRHIIGAFVHCRDMADLDLQLDAHLLRRELCDVITPSVVPAAIVESVVSRRFSLSDLSSVTAQYPAAFVRSVSLKEDDFHLSLVERLAEHGPSLETIVYQRRQGDDFVLNTTTLGIGYLTQQHRRLHSPPDEHDLQLPVLQAALKLPSLRDLTVRDVQFSRCCGSVLQCLEEARLSELDVTGCLDSYLSRSHILRAYLGQGTLTSLSTRSVELPADALREILRLPFLETLRAASTSIDLEGMRVLSKSSLTSLDLNRGSGGGSLGLLLLTDMPALREIDVTEHHCLTRDVHAALAKKCIVRPREFIDRTQRQPQQRMHRQPSFDPFGNDDSD